MNPIDQAANAYLGGTRGEFGESLHWLKNQSASSDAVITAWRNVLSVQYAVAVGDPIPGLDTSIPISTETSTPVLIACWEHARVAVLTCNHDALRTAIARSEGAVATGIGEREHARLKQMCAWSLELNGEHERAAAAADEAGAVARRCGLAEVVVEAHALKALALLTISFDDAKATARRASRMGRTEGLPQSEYLANVVLARVRRFAGAPHLASRILTALLTTASPIWRPWIRWELVAASARVDQTPTDSASEAMSMFAAADAGDRATMLAHGGRVEARLAGFKQLGDEARSWLSALDANVNSAPAITTWLHGEVDAVPPSLIGVSTSAEGETAVYVLALPGAEGRRVLRRGISLATQGRDVQVLAKTRRKQGRVETLTAVLALAGPKGLPEQLCFERVYGFEYVSEMHQGVFDVLLHRGRGYVGDRGQLGRNAGIVKLELTGAILVPDPRCAAPVEDRLLRALVRDGVRTAKEAAENAGVPLRAAQTALRALAEEGVCVAEREGRRIYYRVEDTTFSEPTRH